MLSHQHMHTPHPPLLHPKERKKANKSGVLLEIVGEMFWLDTKSTCSLEQCNLSLELSPGIVQHHQEVQEWQCDRWDR